MKKFTDYINESWYTDQPIEYWLKYTKKLKKEYVYYNGKDAIASNRKKTKEKKVEKGYYQVLGINNEDKTYNCVIEAGTLFNGLFSQLPFKDCEYLGTYEEIIKKIYNDDKYAKKHEKIWNEAL